MPDEEWKIYTLDGKCRVFLPAALCRALGGRAALVPQKNGSLEVRPAREQDTLTHPLGPVNQRLCIPFALRGLAGLRPGAEVVLVLGEGRGVLWSRARWEKRQASTRLDRALAAWEELGREERRQFRARTGAKTATAGA